jgi:hypothetical protein
MPFNSIMSSAGAATKPKTATPANKVRSPALTRTSQACKKKPKKLGTLSMIARERRRTTQRRVPSTMLIHCSLKPLEA